MTKSEFKKGVKIYKSHPLKNGLISVTYAMRLNSTTVTTESTTIIEKNGGALNSLFVSLTTSPIH
jgi:hypothetical protein